MTLNEPSRHASHGRTPAWTGKPDNPLRAAAENLRTIRLHLLMSQAQFGEQLGYSASGLDKIERLDVQMSLHTLCDLVRLTGIPADRLLDAEGLQSLKTDTISSLLGHLLETPLGVLMPQQAQECLQPEERQLVKRLSRQNADQVLAGLQSRTDQKPSDTLQGLILWLETLHREPLEIQVYRKQIARNEMPLLQGLQQIHRLRIITGAQAQLSAGLADLQIQGGLMLYWQALILLLELETAEETGSPFWQGLTQMEQLAARHPSPAGIFGSLPANHCITDSRTVKKEREKC